MCAYTHTHHKCKSETNPSLLKSLGALITKTEVTAVGFTTKRKPSEGRVHLS